MKFQYLHEYIVIYMNISLMSFWCLQELGSQPLPTIVTEDADTSGQSSHDQGHRPRAGEVIRVLSFD